ncbi:RlmE family RNA methyltransferase [Nisaea acidiphila]|uniref:Ribosomal RNA large subunit methyltransferase E n=1 Tax=Nisaea acidiphila TaxID=1862145 RepID=A0A9J7AR14_9PROT|nr:RlmE family RNA methyltransferase [Nisaea acidiphila]UUX49322.1 RlmE family RNA methyltransferase [Nisaea acidiphila]
MTNKRGGRRGGRGSGSRMTSVELKNARRHKPSSQRWLRRQLNDPYVAEAQKLGYRSRAAFKLLQLDEKFRFLKPGQKVVDLGAAPGGWTQIAVPAVGADKGKGTVVGIDLLEMEPVPGADLFQGDFMTDEGLAALRARMDGPVDVVLSDMAASTTGHAPTDHLRTAALCEAAFEFAVEVLAEGGTFVAKVFKGGSEQEMLRRMKLAFSAVRHAKPAASRPESPEAYVVCTGFRGLPESERNQDAVAEDEDDGSDG